MPRLPASRQLLAKSPTGIHGLDDITAGGLPQGRPTLICGGPGCGKTLFAMEFLIRGATAFNEPGVFVSFEESETELVKNVASLGFDLDGLMARKKIAFDQVLVERSEIEETGEYDLEGLFIRLGYAIDSIKAKRVVLDTIESLFSGLSNAAILRSELRRLFHWLKDRGVTAVITGERGEQSLTRQGLEEYVSDCVILLDHRVIGQVSTRRLRVVKYRGTMHGTNEYPFIIGESGVSVLPITSLGLEHKVSNRRISSGVKQLDAMLGGKGYFRGSSILVTGTAGTGKTSLAASFVNSVCGGGERALFFSFEESESQVYRNMESIGMNLWRWAEAKKLRLCASRPANFGLEMHLTMINRQIVEFKPAVVVLDPATSLISAGTAVDAEALFTRLLDYLKALGITILATSLTHGGEALEATNLHVSSLMDTWLLLKDFTANGERNRCLQVIKSRGMAHSDEIREYLFTSRGIELADLCVYDGEALTGATRRAYEAAGRSRGTKAAVS